MNFRLEGYQSYTVLAPELLEIYQPLLGFEAVVVWINLYHALLNGHPAAETELIQRMNMGVRQFRESLQELARFGLIETREDVCIVQLPVPAEQLSGTNQIPEEHRRRLQPLVESFFLRRGGLIQGRGARETASTLNNQLTEQQADELTTRFIKECKFKPTKQLRERFDLWFEQIKDIRLLEELLVRTKNKVELEGTKGTCPSHYADGIVRQWLVEGIQCYEDLVRHDRQFKQRQEYYRSVEKELGRSYNTLTPSEKEIIDRWAEKVGGPDELRALVKKAILSGEYQGKGVPGVVFVDNWLKKKKVGAGKQGKAYTHEHTNSELRRAIKRKTVVFGDADDDQG